MLSNLVLARTTGLILSFNSQGKLHPTRKMNGHSISRVSKCTWLKGAAASEQEWQLCNAGMRMVGKHGGATRHGWGMTHTYWNCFRCHWCWMSLPLQANKKETPIQNTPLRGHMQHKTQMLRSETLNFQLSQATGGLPHPGHQLGSTAPILTPWTPPTCPQSPLSLPSLSLGTRRLTSFHSILFT